MTPTPWLSEFAGDHEFSGVLFDLDGVITPTADVHMAAWNRMFSVFFTETGVSRPYTDADYFDYVDGKPRYDGVASCLASRGIELPHGDPRDAPGTDTVCALGNMKNDAFTQVLEDEGVVPYPGSVRLMDELDRRGIAMAVVSSSRNAPAVLAAAGLDHRFTHVVDGVVAVTQGLPGKPAPDTYLYGAQLISADPARTVVVEDATSGVAAGAAGGFGLVLGVDRGAGRDELIANGATMVVADLEEVVTR